VELVAAAGSRRRGRSRAGVGGGSAARAAERRDAAVPGRGAGGAGRGAPGCAGLAPAGLGLRGLLSDMMPPVFLPAAFSSASSSELSSLLPSVWTFSLLSFKYPTPPCCLPRGLLPSFPSPPGLDSSSKYPSFFLSADNQPVILLVFSESVSLPSTIFLLLFLLHKIL